MEVKRLILKTDADGVLQSLPKLPPNQEIELLFHLPVVIPIPQKSNRTVAGIMDIAKRCAELPELDQRSPDEILGYDGSGIPS